MYPQVDDLKYSPKRMKIDVTDIPKVPNNPYVDNLLFPQTADVLSVKIAAKMNKTKLA